MFTQPYHHTQSVHDFVLKAMLKDISSRYHPDRSFKQRLQFQLIAPQYQREPHWIIH